MKYSCNITNQNNHYRAPMARALTQHLIPIIVIIWLIHILNWLLSYKFNQYGLLPRDPMSLYGIATAPFLHGNFYHLINNSVAFFFLGLLVSLYNKNNHNQLLKLTIFVAFWGGLLTWLFGRPSIHIGLSGVIFGYWGFITINGFFEKSIKSIFISIAAIFLYGGMIFGVIPSSPEVSYESHFFGAVSGFMYSYLYRRKNKRK